MIPDSLMKLMSSRTADFPACAAEVLSAAVLENAIDNCALIMKRCGEPSCTYVAASNASRFSPVFEWMAESIATFCMDLSLWDCVSDDGISWIALAPADIPVHVSCTIDECYGDFRVIASPIVVRPEMGPEWGACDGDASRYWKAFIVLVVPGDVDWTPREILEPLFASAVMIFSRWCGMEHEGSAEERVLFGTILRKMAHDFNNALGIIVGNLEMAIEDELPPDAPCRYSLDQALAASEKVMGLSRRLSGLGKELTSNCTLSETLQRQREV